MMARTAGAASALWFSGLGLGARLAAPLLATARAWQVLDLLIGVNYKEDMAKVQQVLMQVADANPLCLIEPRPLFIFNGFGESSMALQFSVWAVRENFPDLKNIIQREIKEAFDAAGIDIPYPHRTVNAVEPLPVRVVDQAP